MDSYLLLNILVSIKQRADNGLLEDSPEGICSLVRGYTGEGAWPFASTRLKQLFSSWGWFSGDHSYPVPSLHHQRPNIIFNRTYYMWRHEYGRLRYALLEHMIAKLKKETCS